MTEFNSKIKQNSRILKIFLFSICALFACAINAHAQSLVQGTVTDETGESLPGVSVVVKGTTNGTAVSYTHLSHRFLTDRMHIQRITMIAGYSHSDMRNFIQHSTLTITEPRPGRAIQTG